MDRLAGSRGQVILFENFTELSRKLVEEFKKSKSCGKWRLLRNVITRYLAFKERYLAFKEKYG